MARIKSKKYTGIYLNHLENGDVTYYANYKDQDGKKAWFTVGKKSHGITEIFANNKRNELLNQMRLGVDPLAHKKKKKIVTLNDIADKYFDDKYLNKANSKQLGRYNLHIKPTLGDKSIEQITHDDINRLQRSLINAQKAPKTINGIIQLLGSIFNNSKALNPCKEIKKLKENDRRERYLTKDEVNILFANVKDDPTLNLFVHLALNTGGRLETILHIQKKDINISNGSLILHDLKSGGTYTGFAGEHLKEILSPVLRGMKPNDYVIGGNEIPTPSRSIQRHLKRILDQLFNNGLDSRDAKNRVVIHTLRHTFASQLAINGVSLFIIQKLLNHKDITHTQRYSKLAPDSGHDAVKSLFV